MTTNGQFGQPNGNGAGAILKGSMNKWGIGGLTVDTVGNMMAGDGVGTALVKGAATGMLWATAPGAMWAYTAATTVPAMANAGATWYRNRTQWMNQQFAPNVGGMYQDTQRALTMRQAGVQAIQGSRLNARSALGGEARILSDGMHRGGGY